MEKKRKKINVKFIVLILSLIIFLSMSVFTFAWFTDSKSFTGNLTFGSLELDVSGGVSGDGVDSATSKLVFDVTRTSGPAYSTTKKVMPGDTININLTLGLKTGSEPAYYLISITDDNGVFDDAYYFSEDGTNIYVFDGEKTYLQSDPNKVNVASKYCGKITTSAKQTIKIGAKVSESYTEQNSVCNVTCKVFAIQQANLEVTNAKTELLGRIVGLDTSGYTYVSYLESTGEQIIDTGYVYKTKPKIITQIYLKDNNDRDILGTAATDSNCFIVDYGNNLCYARYAQVNPTNYDREFNLNEWVKVSYSDSWIENGVVKYQKSSYNFSGNTQSLNLFGARNKASLRMKIVKFYDGDSLVRNMIPCLRASDNKPGMYDSVTKTFYVNSSEASEFLWG